MITLDSENSSSSLPACPPTVPLRLSPLDCRPPRVFVGSFNRPVSHPRLASFYGTDTRRTGGGDGDGGGYAVVGYDGRRIADTIVKSIASMPVSPKSAQPTSHSTLAKQPQLAFLPFKANTLQSMLANTSSHFVSSPLSRSPLCVIPPREKPSGQSQPLLLMSVRRPTAVTIGTQLPSGSTVPQRVASACTPPPGVESNGGSSPSPPQPAGNGVKGAGSQLVNDQLSSVTAGTSVRQISKLKRFLTTLHQFSCDISPDVGERVHALVTGLVVSTDIAAPRTALLSRSYFLFRSIHFYKCSKLSLFSICVQVCRSCVAYARSIHS